MKYEEVEVNSERWLDLTPLLNEEFRDIVGYEGLYQISNYGRVKSLSRLHKNNGKGYTSKDLILCSSKNIWGYRQYHFSKDNKAKTKTTHRLIMETFVPNPNNYPCINHKDGNKQNNSLENLEWCTYSHNGKEAVRLGLIHFNPHSKGKYDSDNMLSKKIVQKDLNNNIIKVWDSLHQIQRTMNYSMGNICSCCKGSRSKAYNCKWEYYKEEK